MDFLCIPLPAQDRMLIIFRINALFESCLYFVSKMLKLILNLINIIFYFEITSS